MNPDAPLLNIDALTAGYAAPVVGPLSIALRRGETVGITGPNGSGKSTFLAALTGASRIFSGKIEKQPGLRLSLQQQRFPNVRGLPLCAADLLALTGASSDGAPPWLLPLLSERLDTLSGGQLQFFIVWACLRAAADVVLLDEPTNNLDRDSVDFLTTLLRQMRDQGSALLIVSHDADFIDAVCERKVIL